MRKSKVLEKLKKNQPVYILGSGFLDSIRAAQVAGNIGFDCLWIDMEHRPIDYAQVTNIIAGAYIEDTDTIVRVRKESYASYFRPFEDGASGIMIPHCKCAEEVRFVVENAKYPQLGMRGIDGVGLDTNYGLDLSNDYGQRLNQDYKDFANNQTFIAIQIEDLEALDNLEDIASVKGYDIIFIGPGDMRKALEKNYNDVEKVFDEVTCRVAEVAKANGKHWGLPVGSVDNRDKYFDMGARFFAVGSDRSALVQGLKQIHSLYIAE